MDFTTDEEIREAEKTEVDFDTIFPVGYVIDLGKNQYFQTWMKSRIICTKIASRASYFPAAEAAESFVKKELAFCDLEIQIYHIAWILLSWDGLTEVYWQGGAYVRDEKKAVRFLSYQDAKKYQRERCLQKSGVIELHSFREKQFQLTAV